MLKRLLKRLVAPKLREWLETRALYLPSAKRVELAKRAGVPVEVVDLIYEAVRTQALERVDEFLERL